MGKFENEVFVEEPGHLHVAPRPQPNFSETEESVKQKLTQFTFQTAKQDYVKGDIRVHVELAKDFVQKIKIEARAVDEVAELLEW